MNKHIELIEELESAAIALFIVKRMGVSDEVREHASRAHQKACEFLADYIDDLSEEEQDYITSRGQERWLQVSNAFIKDQG